VCTMWVMWAFNVIRMSLVMVMALPGPSSPSQARHDGSVHHAQTHAPWEGLYRVLSVTGGGRTRWKALEIRRGPVLVDMSPTLHTKSPTMLWLYDARLISGKRRWLCSVFFRWHGAFAPNSFKAPDYFKFDGHRAQFRSSNFPLDGIPIPKVEVTATRIGALPPAVGKRQVPKKNG